MVKNCPRTKVVIPPYIKVVLQYGVCWGLNNKCAVRPVDVLQMAANQSDNLLVCTNFNPNSNPIPIINPNPNPF